MENQQDRKQSAQNQQNYLCTSLTKIWTNQTVPLQANKTEKQHFQTKFEGP